MHHSVRTAFRNDKAGDALTLEKPSPARTISLYHLSAPQSSPQSSGPSPRSPALHLGTSLLNPEPGPSPRNLAPRFSIFAPYQDRNLGPRRERNELTSPSCFDDTTRHRSDPIHKAWRTYPVPERRHRRTQSTQHPRLARPSSQPSY